MRPFIKKYIGAQYPVEPLLLTTTNKYGLFLYHCLERPKLKLVDAIIDSSDEREIDPRLYSEVLKVKLGEKAWEEKGCIFSVESQIHFNKFVLQDFNEEFYKYVKHRVGPKGSINKAIRSFLDMYDISEDDLSFKTIQRAFQRRNAIDKSAKSA